MNVENIVVTIVMMKKRKREDSMKVLEKPIPKGLLAIN
jgi:hypothetical protein